MKPEVVQFTDRGRVLRAGTFADADEEAKFAEYYNRSLFPNVTNPANRQSPRDDVIAKLRIDLKVCERSPSQQVFNKLADLTLDFMSKIAKDGQYHPAAHVNAMLAIGEVNSPKTADFLLAALADPKQIDAVRVVAMSDLVHLAGQSGLSDPAVAQPVIARIGQDRPRTDSEKRLSAGRSRRWHTLDARTSSRRARRIRKHRFPGRSPAGFAGHAQRQGLAGPAPQQSGQGFGQAEIRR